MSNRPKIRPTGIKFSQPRLRVRQTVTVQPVTADGLCECGGYPGRHQLMATCLSRGLDISHAVRDVIPGRGGW